MSGFLEDLYFGEIDPQARGTVSSEERKNCLCQLNAYEEYLTTHLSGEEKEQFLAYANAWSAVNGESCLESFITGFRLGAQFMADAFPVNSVSRFV